MFEYPGMDEFMLGTVFNYILCTLKRARGVRCYLHYLDDRVGVSNHVGYLN